MACGKLDCAGCRRAFDPPRYCAECGRRLAVTVTPSSVEGRCRDHGTVIMNSEF